MLTGRIDDTSFPLVYALTCNKKRPTYQLIWEKILEIQPDINPKYVMTDFELAAIGVLREKFPDAKRHGCVFHFGKNIFKHIVEAGLKTVYSDDPNFAWHMKFLYALAFVPQDKVIEAFQLITEQPFFEYDENKPHCTQIHTVVDYFESTYIGRCIGSQGNRRKAMYPIELWNMHDSVLNGNCWHFFSFLA